MKDLNLIPKKYFQEKKIKREKLIKKLFTILMGFILVSAFAVPIFIHSKTDMKKNSLIFELSKNRRYRNWEAQSEQIKATIEKREKEFELANAKIGNFNSIYVLDQIESNITPQINLIGLSLDVDSAYGSSYRLNGIVANQEILEGFIQNIGKVKKCKAVQLQNITKLTNESFNYSFTVILKFDK